MVTIYWVITTETFSGILTEIIITISEKGSKGFLKELPSLTLFGSCLTFAYYRHQVVAWPITMHLALRDCVFMTMISFVVCSKCNVCLSMLFCFPSLIDTAIYQICNIVNTISASLLRPSINLAHLVRCTPDVVVCHSCNMFFLPYRSSFGDFLDKRFVVKRILLYAAEDRH